MKDVDIQKLIGTTLRIGVTLACIVALCGGIYYLVRHGMEPRPEYLFNAQTSHNHDYTTLGGIVHGVLAGQAKEVMQLGVCLLILTPIIRVFMSLIGFVKEKDWLYVAITFIVLVIICSNFLEGK